MKEVPLLLYRASLFSCVLDLFLAIPLREITMKAEM